MRYQEDFTSNDRKLIKNFFNLPDKIQKELQNTKTDILFVLILRSSLRKCHKNNHSEFYNNRHHPCVCDPRRNKYIVFVRPDRKDLQEIREIDRNSDEIIVIPCSYRNKPIEDFLLGLDQAS